MDTPNLTIPAHYRRRSRLTPFLPQILTAMGWFLLAAAFAVWQLSLSSRPERSFWLALSAITMTGAVGLIRHRTWSRWLIGLIAAVIALYGTLFQFAGFYPTWTFWWLGATVPAFAYWTLFFLIGLWHDYYVPRRPPAAA